MDLQRKITFEVKGHEYEMEFPTVGEYLDIETRRMSLSKGTYNNMIQSRLISSGKAMDMIDMIATVAVLCPKLIEETKTKNLLDLDLFDAKELLDVYNKQIKAWVDTWMDVFASTSGSEGQ